MLNLLKSLDTQKYVHDIRQQGALNNKILDLGLLKISLGDIIFLSLAPAGKKTSSLSSKYLEILQCIILKEFNLKDCIV